MQPSPSQISQGLKPADRLRQLLPELFNPPSVSGEQFLRLQLTPDLTVALALSWVEETLRIPAQWVTSIPNTPAHILGLMSSKGEVFWAAYLPQLLQLSARQRASQYYEVVVIRALPLRSLSNSLSGGVNPTDNELFIGLVVPKIKGIVRLAREEIISPRHEVIASLQPYLSGQADVEDQSILVLSAEAIGRSVAVTTG